MKRILKTIITMMLVLTMVISLAACGNNNNNENTNNNNDTNNNQDVNNNTNDDDNNDGTNNNDDGDTNDSSEVDTSDFVEVTYVTLGNIPTNGRMEASMEKLNEIFKEKINAEMKLQYVEWADWQTQYNLLLASGDSSIDLIGTATDWLNAWENVKKGSFTILSEDMLSTYAPMTWEAVTDVHWEECAYEGDIYFIPEDQYTQWTNHGLFYRGDWATEAGLDEINDFDDIETYFDSVLENHEGVIPWDAAGATNLGGLVGGYINAYTTQTTILGTSTGIFSLLTFDNNDPYTVLSPYTQGDILEEAAVMFDRWAEKGFWREDVLNYTGETRELFYSGLSGADQHHTQTFVTGIVNNMETKQPGSDPKFYSWSSTSENLCRDIITHGATAIGFNSQNAERALMAYDLIRNDQECYSLFTLGIEGEDYIVTEPGKFDRPEGFDASSDGLGIDFWWGRNDDLELIDATWYDGRDEIYAEFDTYAIDYPIAKFVFDPDPVSTQIAAISEVCATYIPSIAWGKTPDPAEYVADFQDALVDAGFDEFMNEVQSQLDAFKATIG